METGMVIPFAGASAPSGYLICDGASYLRSSYSALFSVIGTVFGSEDSTHFNVPDMRGRTPVGVGEGVGALVDDVGTGVPSGDPIEPALSLGDWTGHVRHYQAGSEVGAHIHGVNDATHFHGATPTPHNHLQDEHNHVQDAHSHAMPIVNNAPTTGGANHVTSSPSSTLATNTATATNQPATATNQAASALVTISHNYSNISIAANALSHGMDIRNPSVALNYLIKA